MAYQHRVIGLDDLNVVLRQAVKLVTGPEMRDVLLSGGEVIAEQARQNVLDNDLVDTGALHDSIRAVPVGFQAVDILVGVPYGAVHEYGLPDQPITARQRRFFWAKWYETGDTMWKALALSETYTIPARPYLRPAVDTAKWRAARRMAVSLGVAFISKLRARMGI